MKRRHGVIAAVLVAVAGLVSAGTADAEADGVGVVGGTTAAYTPPPIKHVFVINLENKGFDETWGADSKAPYLSQTLRKQGVLLSQYYGIGHNSLDNYIAQISGQGPNPQTQADCQVFTDFARFGTVSPGQALGQGCVYPKDVPTLPGQLEKANLTWKGYMQDMKTSCRHPKINAQDDTQKAEAGDQYAARHNPFVYFHSIIDTASCQNDVYQSKMTDDLKSVSTTPNLSYITPNLCNDGHDAPCVDGRPGGLTSANEWLKTWVPKITSSPAFKKDGALIITFDESEGPTEDSSACCGEGPSANSPLPGITGLGGGRVGALVLSPFVKPNSYSTTPYNHYSLLASTEDIFGLGKLGYASKSDLNHFGTDVWNSGAS